MARWGQVAEARRVGVSEQIISVALFIVGLVSYQQLAAPFCAGLPHTLPQDSRLLAGYPCGGSGFQRTAYVLRHTLYVLHDIVRLGIPDFWVTVAILALAVRMTASFIVPARIYNKVVAPVTMYVERAVMPAFHFLRGARHRPSTMALRCMFNTYPVFDLVFFCSLLGVWEVNMAIEMTYCLWAAINHVFLCSWHKEIAPGGPANVAWQISSRLLVMVTTFYLSMANTIVGRRQQARRAGSDNTVTAAADGHNVTARRSREHRATCTGWVGEETDDGGLGKAITDEVQEQEQSQGSSYSVSVAPAALLKASEGPTSAEEVSELTPSAATRKVAGGVTASDDTAAVVESGSIDFKTVPLNGAASPCAKGVAPPEDQQQAGFGAPSPLNTLNSAAAKASSAAARRVSAIRPYKSPVHRTLMRVKIPWAEPDQLVPGFEQRLANLAAKQGLLLAGAYVRSGCVELVLMLEGLPAQQQQQQQQPPASLVKEEVGFRVASDSTAGTGHGLEITAVLRALGLEPTTADGASGTADTIVAPTPRDSTRNGLELQPNWIGRSRKGHFETRPDGVTVAFHCLDSGSSWETNVCDDDGGDGASGSAYVSLRTSSGKLVARSLLPRALSLSATLPEPDATAWDWVDMTAVGTATKPVAVISIRLEWHHQSPRLQQQHLGCERVRVAPGKGEPPQIEVLLRSGGIYLPVRIAASRWDIGDGRMPSSPHCYSVLDSSGHTAQDGGDTDVDMNGGRGCCEHLACVYDVEVLAAPPAPGVILLEIYSCKADAEAATAGFTTSISHVLPSDGSALDVTALVDMVPLLATSNAAVAVEINGLAATWPDGIERDLDELLHDLGTWEAATTIGASGVGDAGAATAFCLGAKTGEGAADVAAMLMVLAPHLLRYAESIGLSATAASIRAKMDSLLPPLQSSLVPLPLRPRPLPSQPQQMQPDRAPNCPRKLETTEQMAKADDECGTGCSSTRCARAGPVGDAAGTGGPGCGRSRAGGRGWRLAAVFSALFEVLGLAASTPSRAAAYDSFTGAWSVAQGQSVQLVEFLALLSMLVRTSRAGFLPMGPAATVIVVGCGVGTFTTLAWLVLPYRNWVRIAHAAKVPRYLGHVAAKLLVALGFPPPLGVATYVTGLGALLLEGFIIPGACLMSLRSAAIIAAIKLPANVAIILVVGGTHSTLTATLLAARIEAVALATTIACHVYIRLVHERPSATEARGLRPAIGTVFSSSMVGGFGGVDVDVAPISKNTYDGKADKPEKTVH